jgi:hypothetical protein
MHQSNPKPDNPKFIVVYEAESSNEAMVLRSLLQSAGIESPQPMPSDPFPLPGGGELTSDTAILAPASQADDARALIASKPDKQSE